MLLDDSGSPVEAFSHFCERNRDYKFATQKRYSEVVAHFIDYLIEAKAFGIAVTKRHLNAVIDSYPLLLRDGSDALCARLSKSVEEHPEDIWLLRVAKALDKSPIQPASFSNTLSPINRFLRLSEALAAEAFEQATLAGMAHNNNHKDLIEALSGADALSEFEKRRMRQNSVLGSVIRFRGRGLERPRRIRATIETAQVDVRHLDFPIDFVTLLANVATSWRDRALWLLLAASGIRISEALNLQWSDIDIENQKVFVLDPAGRRFGQDMTVAERRKFKGRTVSFTYLIQPFRQAFFHALEMYVKHELVPPQDKADAGFVFQYIEGTRRGKPYVGVSNSALNANFKAACARAQIPGPAPSGIRKWTIHSLRHLYGVYMLNDFPVDAQAGRYGLELVEVQMLMGHRNINSTRHYARKTRRNLENKLAQADQLLMDIPDSGLFVTAR
ncbi:MAG: site-specific integrase [Thiobacillus sp.]|nr:site-specific integrase [Thiobacillus sp.]